MLVDAALPGAVRIGKEDLDREPLEHLLVLEQLLVLTCIGMGSHDKGLEETVVRAANLASHRLSAHVFTRRKAVRPYGLQAIIIRF